MAIVRWTDPFKEFAQMQDRLNRAFSDAYGRSDEGLLSSGAWLPPVDIYQNGEHELVLKAELPDMAREDIDVNIANGTLTIKGEKKLSGEVKEEQFHRVERRYGTFSRSFSLPPTVDAGRVNAEYKNGVLTVKLPMAPTVMTDWKGSRLLRLTDIRLAPGPVSVTTRVRVGRLLARVMLPVSPFWKVTVVISVGSRQPRSVPAPLSARLVTVQAVLVNSKAPMSQSVPCGRATPR